PRSPFTACRRHSSRRMRGFPLRRARRQRLSWWTSSRDEIASRMSVATKSLMKHITLHRESEHRRTFAFVFEPDENPVALLTKAADEYHLASCQVSAVGGFSQA